MVGLTLRNCHLIYYTAEIAPSMQPQRCRHPPSAFQFGSENLPLFDVAAPQIAPFSKNWRILWEILCD
jgi:hypothetical protein